MQSRTDVRGQTDLVDRSYGGGCATRRGTERAIETKQSWPGCTQRTNPLPFVTAIVASNPGDFGQGRVRCVNTGASRSLTSSYVPSSPSSCALSFCRSLSSAESSAHYQYLCRSISEREPHQRA